MRLSPILAAACLAMSLASTAEAADAAKGKQLFQKCAECHSDTGVSTDVGPSLKGVIGRKAASLDDFRYSAAMKRSGITWDDASLKEYIANPQEKVRGNRMPFSGFAGPGDVDDIIAYLMTLS
jgi:cytochrome c